MNKQKPKVTFTKEQLKEFLQLRPICPACKKPMVNAVDNITGKVSKYLWKTTCEHNKNLILSKG